MESVTEKYLDKQWTLLRRAPNTQKQRGTACPAWLYPNEVEQLKAVASALGMSPSEYLRASFINNFKEAEAAGVLNIEKVATPA